MTMTQTYNHYQVLVKIDGKWELLTNTHAASSEDAIAETRWEQRGTANAARPMKTWLLQEKQIG